MSKSLCFIGGGKGTRYAMVRFSNQYEEDIAICGQPVVYDTFFYVDDKKDSIIGEHIPYLGPIKELANLDPRLFDLFCTVSRNMGFRRNIFEEYKHFNFPNMSNSVVRGEIGKGNFIFNGVVIEHFSKIGDNNIISSGCIINHDNVIGNSNLFGPSCMFSGTVTIGDNCDFGSGIVVQPRVKIGNNCKIASGSVIVGDLPDDTRVVAKTDWNQAGIYLAERFVR